MTTRPISPAGPYPVDVAAPTPPRRLTPGAVPWRERCLSCPVAATLAECDATGEEAADVYAAHHATMQATIAHLTAYALDDPWQDIGEGVAIRRERGRVVEVRCRPAESPIALLPEALQFAVAHVGAALDPGLSRWEYIAPDSEPAAWYIRVREQQ